MFQFNTFLSSSIIGRRRRTGSRGGGIMVEVVVMLVTVAVVEEEPFLGILDARLGWDHIILGGGGNEHGHETQNQQANGHSLHFSWNTVFAMIANCRLRRA